MKKIKVLILLVLGISLIFSCKDKEEERIFLLSDPGKQIFEIRNDGTKTAKFRLALNGLDISSEENILSFIKQMEDEYPGELLELKAFRFVRDYTWHDNLVTKYSWAYSPYVLVNSLGGGLCGFRSAVLTNILLKLEYKTRSWCLEGHVVTEVFSNNRWQLLDPDYGVYYFNKDHKIASLAEIIEDHTLITNPITPIVCSDNLSFVKVYSSEMAYLYTSTEDNTDFKTQYNSSLESTELYFYLPPKSIFTFPISKEMSGEYYAFAELILPANYTGSLPIPLVIAGFEGDAIIEYQGVEYQANKFDANYYINKNPQIEWECTVLENKNGLKVFYYINPKIYAAKEKNEIVVKGYNLKGVSIGFSKNQELSLVMPYQEDFLYRKIESFVAEINLIVITDNIEFSSVFAAEYCEMFILKCKEDSLLNEKIDFEGLQFDCDSLVNVFAKDSLTDYSLYLKSEYVIPSFRKLLKNRMKNENPF